MVGIPFPPSKSAKMAGETAGKSYRQVALEHNCSVGTVAYAFKQQRERGTNRTATQSRRPRTLSARDLSRVRRIITSHRRQSLAQSLPTLSTSGFSMSLSSFKRGFQRLGLMRYIARFKPCLNPRAKHLRHICHSPLSRHPSRLEEDHLCGRCKHQDR